MNEPVIACRIDFLGLSDHFRGDIHSNNFKTELLRESGGPSCTAAKVERSGPRDVLANNLREITIGKIISIPECKLSVSIGSRAVFVAVSERHNGGSVAKL
jgi:hypothetical protein